MVLQKVLRETETAIPLKVQAYPLKDLWWSLFYAKLDVSIDQELY